MICNVDNRSPFPKSTNFRNCDETLCCKDILIMNTAKSNGQIWNIKGLHHQVAKISEELVYETRNWFLKNNKQQKLSQHFLDF